MQPQLEMFNVAIEKTERADITGVEVAKIYFDLRTKINDRLNAQFIPLTAKSKFLLLEKEGILKRSSVEPVITNFYMELLRYLDLWAKRLFDDAQQYEPFLLAKNCDYNSFSAALDSIDSIIDVSNKNQNENEKFDAFHAIQRYYFLSFVKLKFLIRNLYILGAVVKMKKNGKSKRRV